MISELSGVSRETVSHILGGKFADRYKESTRAKVLEIAAQLNYRPHRGAQAMKSGRSKLIAIAHSGMGIEAAEKANLTLSRIIHEKGYDYLALDMNWLGGCTERTITEIIRSRVEGVLISHVQGAFNDRHIDELRHAGIPTVSVNGIRRPNVPLFCDNLVKAFREMTEHLVGLGHRCILLPVVDPRELAEGVGRTTHDRIEGFRSAIQACGEWLMVSEEEFLNEGVRLLRGSSRRRPKVLGVTIVQTLEAYTRLDKPVYRFCKKLIEQDVLPDALMCVNDLYAMEAIAAALEYKIEIPKRLAVTGYDNDRIGEFPCFGITTAQQDTEGMCRAAVEMLIKLIDNPETPWENRLFDSRLIVRTSCGAGAKAGARRNRG